MSRYFKPINLAEFKKKINPLVEGEDFPYSLPPVIEKDLNKVNFAFENYEYGDSGFCDYPCGYKVLSNGMPCLFVNSGGDWEYPICFALYFDGTQIRGYIPQKGNMWSRKCKTAFGSEGESNLGDDKDAMFASYEQIIDEAKEWAKAEDVEKAKVALKAEKIRDSDYFDFDNKYIDKFVSEKAIFEDIMSRIKEKP